MRNSGRGQGMERHNHGLLQSWRTESQGRIGIAGCANPHDYVGIGSHYPQIKANPPYPQIPGVFTLIR